MTHTANNFKEHFTEMRNFYWAFYVSKKTFDSRKTNGGKFQICIDVDDLSETNKDNQQYRITLSVVPTFESLTENEQMQVMNEYGYDAEQVDIMNVHQCGFRKELGVMIVPNEGKEIDECEGVAKVLKFYTEIYELIVKDY